MQGLYVNAGPDSAFKYDPEKAQEEAVKKKLEELEKIRKIRKNKKSKKDQPEEEGQDLTFIEKVATQVCIVSSSFLCLFQISIFRYLYLNYIQVIKNLQVIIKDIHFRYEDSHTIPGQTFSVGVTLSSLILHSTDANYKVINYAIVYYLQFMPIFGIYQGIMHDFNETLLTISLFYVSYQFYGCRDICEVFYF